MRKTYLYLVAAMLITMVLDDTASGAAKKPHGGRAQKPAARAETVHKNTVQAYVPVDTTIEFVRLHNEWGPLRFADLSSKIKEHWMRAMFQGALTPERGLSRALEIDNLAMSDSIAALEREKSILYDREARTAAKLRAIELSYENLKVKSAKYLILKENYDELKTTLAAAQEKNNVLARENESIKIERWIKWIFTGALILFAGWLAGILSARRRKKRHHYYQV